MGDAATEIHLLKEAEAHLGDAIWRKVENIEELSMEYWNLRKLIKDYDRVSEEIKQLQAILNDAHKDRADVLKISNDSHQDLLDDRKLVLTKLEEIARERDQVVAKARSVRRNYDGMKTKQEVLSKEGEQVDEIEKATLRLSELKNEFTELKQRREVIADNIAKGNKLLHEIEVQILERKKQARSKASEAFIDIGETNQQLSNLRAELSFITSQMLQLYSEIGRYISRNAYRSAECRRACKDQTALVEVMAALHRSIKYNNILADLS